MWCSLCFWLMNIEFTADAFGGTSVGGTVVAWLEEDTWREVEADAEDDEDGTVRSEGFSIFLNLSCSEGSSSSSLDELGSRLTALATAGTLALQELMSMVSGQMDVVGSQPAWEAAQSRESELGGKIDVAHSLAHRPNKSPS